MKFDDKFDILRTLVDLQRDYNYSFNLSIGMEINGVIIDEIFLMRNYDEERGIAKDKDNLSIYVFWLDLCRKI